MSTDLWRYLVSDTIGHCCAFRRFVHFVPSSAEYFPKGARGRRRRFSGRRSYTRMMLARVQGWRAHLGVQSVCLDRGSGLLCG
jgi:hypothetical protein